MNSFHHTGTPIATILLALLCLASCKNNGAILQTKMQQRDQVTARLNDCQQRIIGIQAQVNQLNDQREGQYNLCQAYQDSARQVIRESPMAAAWIHEFDQEPLDILQEYRNTASEEDRDDLFKGHLVLLAYGAFSSNQVTIKSVRLQLQYFDRKKKACFKLITGLNKAIARLQGQASLTGELASNLETQRTELNSEINTFQN